MGLITGGAGGPTTTADRNHLVPVPTGWTMHQAAGAVIGYATAYYALHDLAGLRSGQNVLIHTATGGVGIAATHLARHFDAQAYATASLPKHHTLNQTLGYPSERIGNSRTTDYAEQFLAETGGRGMDVVLHSLAHEHTDASLRLLPRGGHFLDMGKTDVRDPQVVAGQNPATQYLAFDLIDAGGQRTQQILSTLRQLFESGELPPLPITTYPMPQAPTALRRLSQARHIGKIVLSHPDVFRPEGTTLITGGTGALARSTAHHLIAHHQTRHLVLASRTGPEHPQAPAIVAEHQALGAQTQVVACDTTDPGRLRDLLETIPADHPLTRVVHTAAVTVDRPITALTRQDLRAVLLPKVATAWSLHRLPASRSAELILYSSIAGLVGNPGQANYAAANTFLDALAQHRHVNGAGSGALALAWGLWRQESTLTGTLDEAQLRRLHAGGIRPLETDRALALLDAALAGGYRAVAPADLDERALRDHPRPESLALPLRHLVRARPDHTPAVPARQGDVVARLHAVSPTERHPLLVALVQGQAADILGHSQSDSVRPEAAFKDIGFDSLTAVELRNQLTTITGLRLPSTLIFDFPTPAALAGRMESLLFADDEDEEPGDEPLEAELRALEGALKAGGITPDPDRRAAVTRRLKDLLTRWDRSDGSARPPQDFENASDEELFRAFDSDLGIR
jgi:NADPH:quinone reductase-like Zn-dependent oxidoreductase/NAD(P)-dependent dehydrogenase (short-subunit alcohol dehydrogenase family)/acyl carrier protein